MDLQRPQRLLDRLIGVKAGERRDAVLRQ